MKKIFVVSILLLCISPANAAFVQSQETLQWSTHSGSLNRNLKELYGNLNHQIGYGHGDSRGTQWCPRWWRANCPVSNKPPVVVEPPIVVEPIDRNIITPPSSVPIPASLWLMISGLVGIGFIARRKVY